MQKIPWIRVVRGIYSTKIEILSNIGFFVDCGERQTDDDLYGNQENHKEYDICQPAHQSYY